MEFRKEVEKEDSKIRKQSVKLRNNCIFGESTENPMSKFDVKLVTTRKNTSSVYLGQPLKEKNNFVMEQ